MLCEGRHYVNEFSSATGTYEASATATLSSGSRLSLPRVADDKLLDSGQIVQHGPAGTVFIPAPDGAQYASVILMRALGPTTGEQALFPALSQEIHEGTDEAHDGAIVRGGGDGRVEGGVLGHTRAALRHFPRLLVEDPLHLRDLLATRASCREGGNGRLEQEPCLEELSHRFPVRQDDESERLDEGLDGYVLDEGALSGPDFDEPAALQRAERLAHRGPAHAESLGKLALGRKTVARGEPAVGDQGFDLADDVLVDPDGLDRLELHQAWPGSPPWRVAVLASHHPSARMNIPSTIDSHRSAALAAEPSHRCTTGSSVIISPAT